MATIAITGASGNLGRATRRHLLKRGVAPGDIVLVVRDEDKVKDVAVNGVQVRRADYTDAASLERAFKGVDELLFISTSALGEERMRQHTNVVNAAKAAKPGHVIYTSVIKPAANAKFGASPGHFHTERLLGEAGLPTTFFRNNLYLDIVPFVYASAVQSGVLLSCAGDGKVGFTAREDMAEALAVVLSGGAPLKPSYAMTPTRPSYGLAEVAAELGRANNKTIQYTSVSPEEFRSKLTELGVPPPGVDMAVGLAEAVRAGEFDASSKDLETLLGRAPVDLRTFLSKGR